MYVPWFYREKRDAAEMQKSVRQSRGLGDCVIPFILERLVCNIKNVILLNLPHFIDDAENA